MKSWEKTCGLKKPMTRAEAEVSAVFKKRFAYKCTFCKSWHTKKIKKVSSE